MGRSRRSANSLAGRGDEARAGAAVCAAVPLLPAGFTLLELMVVIGVVATLMALLLPTVSRVRESARRATDLSNLRQLTIACTLYAHDNDGALPPGRISSAATSGDDYTWLSYKNCWKPLVARIPQLDAINACASVREGYVDASEFGRPQPGWPDDITVGWVYWGGRDDLLAAGGGVPQYRSLRRLGQRPTPGSATLWTCWCWDSNGKGVSSVCPHVGTHFIEYPSGVALMPPPDGLGVALVDGSASFVPWGEMVLIQQANGFKLYYQP